MDELIAKLTEMAAKKVASDSEDFSACDYSGGNYDDAYDLGVSDGEIILAREILPALLLLKHNKAFS